MSSIDRGEQPLVAVYVVTYRRNELLRRALRSVINQCYPYIVVRVVNDDPEDSNVAAIVDELGDSRVRMFEPVTKRGATANFNLVFEETEAHFASLLEDDNWWDPSFIRTMLNILLNNADRQIVVGNELIWREEQGGAWTNTNKTIWDFYELRKHHYDLPSICGHAVFCNSSFVVRLPAINLRTPLSIPVDVTEHFRERLIDAPVILCGQPLVNYAETITTARGGGEIWGQYQIILIGSCFIALGDTACKSQLASQLWTICESALSPRAVTLVSTGIALPEARSLIREAPLLAILRWIVAMIRKPGRLLSVMSVRAKMSDSLSFLVAAPLTQALAAKYKKHHTI